MDTLTIYIILSILAAIFLAVHLWEELTNDIVQELDYLEAQLELGYISEDEYEREVRRITEDM